MTAEFHKSVRQYENSKRVARAHVCHVVGRLLVERESRGNASVEGERKRVSPALLPTVHRLKWSIQRDSVSRQMRSKHKRPVVEWIELLGPRILPGDERTRLALCPGIRRIVKYFDLVE